MRTKLSSSFAGVTAILTGWALASGCCTRKSSSSAYYSATPGEYAYARSSAGGASESSMNESTTASMGTNMVVPLYKESLAVGKREVDQGSIRIRKIVKTETVNQPVELRHEEIVIEREPGTGQPSQDQFGKAFQEQETVIHLTREEPVVEKQTSSAGQIVLQRKTSSSQTNIEAQVRREDVDIVKFGNPQNVTIGQNVTSREGEGMGAAESPGGQSSGMAAQSSQTISDPSTLSGAADASSLAGKEVDLSSVKVDTVIGDKLVGIKTDNGKSVYAVCPEGTSDIKAGDNVHIKGTVKTGSAPSLGDAAAQVLSSQPAYIEVEKIEPASQ